MDAGSSNFAYRKRKRDLNANGGPSSPESKRRLFPANVADPNRRAAKVRVLLRCPYMRAWRFRL
jgi:hypothetical protein